MVSAGAVLVSGALAERPARLVAAGEPVLLARPPARFVGRGGMKLDAAIERFGVAVEGRRCLDVGASTGGFTDCLLQRGAASVVSLDVGRGQLDSRLRADARVSCHERTDIRRANLEDLGGRPFHLIVVDVSFVSLRAVAGAVASLAEPGGDLVVLVKPQFEAGRREASRGRGVIRDPSTWRRVLGEVSSAMSAEGATMISVMPSPLLGAEGNVEFLARLVGAPGAPGGVVTDSDLDDVTAEAASLAGRA